MLLLLKAELNRPVNTRRLQSLSGNQSQYDRRIRELRERLSISTGLNRSDIGPDDYLLESLDEKDLADQFSSKTIAAIFKRDGYRCQDCGWSKNDPPQGGRRYLEAHHKTHRAEGGKSDAENGVTLCNVCHAARHAEFKWTKSSTP
jgi:predicted restriction endonuclease